MTYASKTTFCLNNLKILRPKVTKNIKNLRKKFCEYPHSRASSKSKYNLVSLLSHSQHEFLYLTKTYSLFVFSGGEKYLYSLTCAIMKYWFKCIDMANSELF